MSKKVPPSQRDVVYRLSITGKLRGKKEKKGGETGKKGNGEKREKELGDDKKRNENCREQRKQACWQGIAEGKIKASFPRDYMISHGFSSECQHLH